MNMLTNERQWCFLNKDEKKAFEDLGVLNCDYLFNVSTEGVQDWRKWAVDNGFHNSYIFRLKLKEAFYKMTIIESGKHLSVILENPSIDKNGNIDAENEYFEDGDVHEFSQAICGINDPIYFAPATQSEINSVKPEFKRGDVVVHYYDNNDVYIMRMKDVIPNNHASGYSRISPKGKFGWFIPNGINLSKATKATPDQIKQLELEEMKHGKKWNGDSYGHCLTSDGLTFNELIKHHLSEIEYKNGGVYKSVPNDNALDKDWIARNAFAFGQVATTIDKFRLKPKEEGFMELPICWKGGNATVEASKLGCFGAGHLHVSKFIGGHCCEGNQTHSWHISCFTYDKDCEIFGAKTTRPIVFSDDCKSVDYRATHVILVKVGE